MVSTTDTRKQHVRLGTVVGIHGLDGWLKLYSYTQPKEKIFDYRPLIIAGRADPNFEGKAHGQGLLLRPSGCSQRSQVEALVGAEVAVNREALPPPPPGEYYWADLEGLAVVGTDGFEYGTVSRLLATGANDVLVVKGQREYLIPFVQQRYVVQVDLANRRILVDWAPDYL